MKPISKLQMAAVRGRWASLEWLLEFHDENGSLIHKPTLEQLRAVGFSTREANKHLRLRAGMAVLKTFRPPVVENPAPWAQRAKVLKAERLERMDDALEWATERHYDEMLDAYQLEQAAP